MPEPRFFTSSNHISEIRHIRSNIWAVGWLGKRWDAVFSQVVHDSEGCVIRRFVLVELPRIGDCWADASGSFPQSSKHCHVKRGIHSLIRRYKLFMNYFLQSKKTVNMHFTFDLLM